MAERNSSTHELQSKIAALEDLLATLERTVVEQSDRLERSSAAQAHLAAIVQSADAAIVSLSLDFRIRSWNPGAERLFGYSREEVIGRCPADFWFCPAERGRAKAMFFTDVENFCNPGSSQYLEDTVRRKDGSSCEISLFASGIYDAEGRLSGISAILRDISDQRRKERDLARLAAIVESSDDAITSISTDFRVTSWNRSAEKLFGLSAGEAIGQPLESTLAPQLRETVRRNLVEDLAAMGQRRDFVRRLESPIPRRDGTVADVSLVVSGIYAANGTPVGMSQIFRDITERKRGERELARMASIVNASEDAIIGVSQDLKIVTWNPAAEKAYGFTASQAIGQGLDLFVPPAELAQTIAGCRRVLETGKPATWEQHVERKDGTRFILAVNIFTTRDPDGAVMELAGIGRDITKLKEIEKELREAHEYTRGLIESSVDAMVMVGSWNPSAERLFGYGAAEIVGHSAALLAPLDCRAELVQHAQNVRLTGRPETFETSRSRKDGSTFDVAITQSPVLDSAGVIAGLSVTANDISQRKLMERELAQARDAALEGGRLKSEFLANMSHEIRTPLNSIIGMTGLLLDTELNPEQREFTQDVRDSGDALLSLINDILDFSKISAGKLVFEDIDFDISETVESAAEMVANLARRKRLEMTISLDLDVPRLLRGDPGRLRQILLNLLGNAIKFTERGEIGIAVSKLGENPHEASLRFEVRDTGIGIPEDKQEHLFEAFTQVDASTPRRYGGTGLGLSIARELVRGMQGTIALSSTPGAGTTIWFTITFAKQVDTSSPAAERFTSLTGTRIIVVDDNANSRQILERMVSNWGMCSVTAASAPEALELVRAQPCQVALLDVMMPEVDGIELARRIKADPALAKTAVIFASSVGSRRDFSARLVGLEVSAWLMKPVPESLLYNALVKVAVRPELPSTAGAASGSNRGSLKASPRQFRLPGGSKPKVLLAEDNPINQKVAKLQLAKIGLEVDTVANGQEAVDAVSRRHYDLIFMDCQMPEMDGYEATREIRRREGAVRRTTIVAMTAHALPGDREKCLEAGMDSYISKPVTQQALETTLSELLADGPLQTDSGSAPAARNGNTGCAIEPGDEPRPAQPRGTSR